MSLVTKTGLQRFFTGLKNVFALKSHTHNYAGSASAGGSANSAVKLDTATAGSATRPVYFSGGKPAACTYTLGKSVPADAKFTDTVYTHPTTTGNKHIPAGGSSGQILRWASDGTATWGADNNTTYSAFKGSTTSAAGGAGLVPAPGTANAAQFLKGNGAWSSVTKSDVGLGNVDNTADSAKSVKYATSATNDAKSQAITGYVRGLSISGRTITVTKGDGTTSTLTTQDTNTTYGNMGAATSSAAGSAGLVPAPTAGAQAKFLRGDGTWQVPTDHTYSNMKGATSSAAGSAGLVPAPAAGTQNDRYLRADGTWQIPPDTNTTYGVATTGANGLMSPAMVTKLNGIAAGATKVTVDSALSATSTNPVANSAIYKKFPTQFSKTLTVDGWKESGGKYTQQVTWLTANTTGGAFTPSKVYPPMTTQTGTDSTDAAKRRALYIVATGTTVFSASGTNMVATVTVATKPTCDIDVYWLLER